ncbi:MAG: hypothetical protein MAG551_01362 [Candidatus Scalindua arabica]|uniref:Uncharacterized protein n=1 Tax=Candidatus Scalindua arabica TaxID=1127984 RepID=A0A941W2C5_9BACT|nr:hypothetical protein [Candidatus Scalindua arabica]
MIELVWDAPFIRILKKWKKRHPDLIANFHSRLKLFESTVMTPNLKRFHFPLDFDAYLSIIIPSYSILQGFIPHR